MCGLRCGCAARGTSRLPVTSDFERVLSRATHMVAPERPRTGNEAGIYWSPGPPFRQPSSGQLARWVADVFVDILFHTDTRADRIYTNTSLRVSVAVRTSCDAASHGWLWAQRTVLPSGSVATGPGDPERALDCSPHGCPCEPDSGTDAVGRAIKSRWRSDTAADR